MRERRGFTLIELMIVVAIIGLLAAIAVPNFIRFQARSKQSEAKANLKALFQAEKAHYAAKDKYSTQVLEVGFVPERNNRYAYFLDTFAGPFDDRTGTVSSTLSGATAIMVDLFRFPNTAPTAWLCGTTTGLFGQEFAAGAQGNIDSDPVLDQWTVSSVSRVMPPTCDAAGSYAAGEQANEQNDVNR